MEPIVVLQDAYVPPYLGKKVRDIVTGFEGTATGVVFYLSGCAQVSVQRPIDKDGKLPEREFFDIQRLTVVPDEVPVALDNGARKGFEAPPPPRTL